MVHDELVEKVARLYEDKWGIRDYGLARAALAVARPAIREECAKVCDTMHELGYDNCGEAAAAIRALIPSGKDA